MTCDIRIGFSRSNGFRTSIVSMPFRQSCCGPSSRHRSCFALSAFEIAFYPFDNTPSAAAISQGTTEFSNCWVPQIDVGSQQLSLLCGLQLPQPRLRDQVLQPSPVLCMQRSRNFPVVSTSSSRALSRNLCANCMAWLRASPCITVSQHMEKIFAVQQSFSGYRFLLSMLCPS